MSQQAFQGSDQASQRALIEQLIAATRLYDTSEAVTKLMDFTIRLREFAPFNSMLLNIQKPGLTHAATANDWHQRFGRVPGPGARPLLILRAMGPVDFVFDFQDTEGRALPVDAFSFPTLGTLSDARFDELMMSVRKDGVETVEINAGDARAGWIRLSLLSSRPKGKNLYQMAFNGNHPAPTRFVTVAHELAHLYLGHLGEDRGRRVPDRSDRSHPLREVEAEMAAYLVARRSGIKPKSESYLSDFKGAIPELDLYAVMRAANAVETSMGIATHQLWKEKGKLITRQAVSGNVASTV